MYLNCRTWYSLRYGTISPIILVDEATKRGITTLVITDINNSTAFLEVLKAAVGKPLKLIAGIEFQDAQNRTLYIGIAQNRVGFQHLNSFLSTHLIEQTPLPLRAPQLPNVYFVYPAARITKPELLFPWEFIGISPLKVNQLAFGKLRHHPKKLLFCHTLTMVSETDYDIHINLRAVAGNTLLSKLQAADVAAKTEVFLTTEQINYARERFPEIAKQTDALLYQCSFDFDFKATKNKKLFSASAADDLQLLTKLAYDGFNYRFAPTDKIAAQRLEKELKIIGEMGFVAYFLIAWDIVRYSMSRGFYHVGRGSGANSLVAYCLKITDVNPIELNLYFERFLNPKRTTPPDFDIDFSWDQRDDVFDYIFKRYGQQHTALLGTVNTFSDRSIIREIGKAHGLPKSEIDRIIDSPADKLNFNKVVAEVFAVYERLQNFPNLLSIHAGGVLISEEPITNFCSMHLPPKGFQTIQFDMYTAEDVGLDKFDILSQRGIGHIKDAVRIIKENRKQDIDIHAIQQFKDDEWIPHLLSGGRTIGCFYVESPAMRQLLGKLHCKDYLTLVAASSIIRPGVSSSGMMREFILRHHAPQSFQYLHPVMEEQLGETYGVMVYQEDVLKVCHHYAGMDLGDADVLRRAMSGKYRSAKAFAEIQDNFFNGAKALGRPETTTEEVWRQISSFGGYSFCKAHSASFAVESYQSLYLKAYFPLEFMVGVINNFGGFYKTWLYVHEAKMSGGVIHPPHANYSELLTRLYGIDLFLGLIHIKGLEKHWMETIPAERLQNGEYRSLFDFVNRLKIPLEQLTILIQVGALRFTDQTKKDMLRQAPLLYAPQRKEQMGLPQLFATPNKQFTLPGAADSPVEDAFDELNLLGFPVSLGMFDLLHPQYQKPSIVAQEQLQFVGKQVQIVGQLVTYKTIRTRKGLPMVFGTLIDREGNFFDTTHFPDSLEKYQFKGEGLYYIEGRMIEEFGVPSIEVQYLERLPLRIDPRFEDVRMRLAG